MTIDLETIPHALDGTSLGPGKDEEGEAHDDMTLRAAIVMALQKAPTAGLHPTGGPNPVSSDELVKRAMLGSKVQEASGQYKLTKEEVALVEKCVSALWTPEPATAVLAALHGLQADEDAEPEA